MPKDQEGAQWDGREAYHRATMAVYADLGTLIEVLRSEPDLRVALLTLDWIGDHRAPELGDTEVVVKLKHAVGHLVESMNTVRDVRAGHSHVGSAFWRGDGIDRTWGSIASGSYHDVVFFAAAAVLELDETGAAQSGRTATPGGADGIIRRDVITAATDTKSWRRLAENLEHEYRSSSLLPLRAQEKSATRTADDHASAPDPASNQTAYVRQLGERWHRATQFACGGGLPSTPTSQRAILFEITNRLLGCVNGGSEQHTALSRLEHALCAIRELEAWAEGPTYKLRSICPRCGKLDRRSSGRCSADQNGCDGEVEVLGEDAWAKEAAHAKKRLVDQLSKAIARARPHVVNEARTGTGESASLNLTEIKLTSAELEAGENRLLEDQQSGRAVPNSTERHEDDTGPTATLLRSGKVWNVGFGEQSGQMTNLKGLKYIQKLIQYANRPTHTWTLEHGTPPPSVGPDPLIDEQGLRETREAAEAFEEQASSSEDPVARMELRDKAAKLRAHLRLATQGAGGHGKSRGTRNDITRTTENVGKAIKRALKEIEVVCPALHAHLVEHIDEPASTKPVYRCPPDEMPDWHLRN